MTDKEALMQAIKELSARLQTLEEAAKQLENLPEKAKTELAPAVNQANLAALALFKLIKEGKWSETQTLREYLKLE